MPRFFLAREEYVQLYVPEGAASTSLEGGLATVYTFTNPAGRPTAIAFVGQQAKPVWNYRFRTEQQRAEEIAKLFGSVRARKAQAQARRAERDAGHSFQTGDIVYTSWGYEQTNVEWYRVTRATKSYIWLKRLALVEEASTGMMSGTCVPGQETTKPVTKHYARGESVHIEHHSASKWEGRPKHYSTYG